MTHAVGNVMTDSLKFVISTFFALILRNKKKTDRTEKLQLLHRQNPSLVCLLGWESPAIIKLLQVCNYRNREWYILWGPCKWKKKYVQLPSNIYVSMVHTLGIADSRLTCKHQNNAIVVWHFGFFNGKRGNPFFFKRKHTDNSNK
jgi:hypothetical protein